MYHAEILLDSLSPNGTRLTTMRVTMPRFILAELNTHRVKSKNAGSSRAISVSRRIQQILDHPVMPIEWGVNQRGMSADTVFDPSQVPELNAKWIEASRVMVEYAQWFADRGVHRQLVNRLIEPWAWVQVIISSTMWNNFYRLRLSKKAQPEMRVTAEHMKAVMDVSEPTPLQWGDWHVPALKTDEHSDHVGALVSAGRLARVSYELEGKSASEEMELANRLIVDEHWSPFEHQAFCRSGRHDDCRNFKNDWIQFRSTLDASPITN